MTLAGYVVMPIVKNERTYLFHIPMGSPYADVREVCNEVLQNIDLMEAEAAKQQIEPSPAQDATAAQGKVETDVKE
jgi:hypothetical protein